MMSELRLGPDLPMRTLMRCSFRTKRHCLFASCLRVSNQHAALAVILEIKTRERVGVAKFDMSNIAAAVFDRQNPIRIAFPSLSRIRHL
jgi:hypothetical protein